MFFFLWSWNDEFGINTELIYNVTGLDHAKKQLQIKWLA